MPDEPEADALLALMLLQHSRRDARVGPGGELITLEDQDRGRWHRDEIAEAEASARRLAGPLTSSGTYRLQAEIAALPRAAADRLGRGARPLRRCWRWSLPSPVVRAQPRRGRGDGRGPRRGLALVGELVQRGELAGYHLLAATRADLLRRRGDSAEAAAEYERALALAPSEAERRFLRRGSPTRRELSA